MKDFPELYTAEGERVVVTPAVGPIEQHPRHVGERGSNRLFYCGRDAGRRGVKEFIIGGILALIVLNGAVAVALLAKAERITKAVETVAEHVRRGM